MTQENVKKNYCSPNLRLIRFSASDIVLASKENHDPNQGEWDENNRKKGEW